jgi:2-(1,2-epoxy-1,2-dihydrophenyl)acetyl-CoA isomerase
VKKLLLTTYASRYEDQLDREAQLIAECADSADGKEGIGAFLGKRKPEFA